MSDRHVADARSRTGQQVRCRSGAVLGRAGAWVLLAVFAAAGSVRAEETQWGLYRWADVNWWKDVEIDFFNTQEWIAAGGCFDPDAHCELIGVADYVVTYALQREFGIKIHIDKHDPLNPQPFQYDPAHPEHTQAFRVAVLAQPLTFGGTLRAKIRKAPPPGKLHGGDVEADMPVIKDVTGTKSEWGNLVLTSEKLCWVEIEIDLGGGAFLTDGDYYFCVKEQWPGLPTDDPPYIGVAMDTVGESAEGYAGCKGGFAIMSLWPPLSSWSIEYSNPLMVVRPGDPTPTHPKPIAKIWVDHKTVHKGETVKFDGSLSSDPERPDADPEDVLTFDWDFGDDWTSDQMTTEHVYDTAEEYTVTLKVCTVPWGQCATTTETIEVKEVYPPRISGFIVERTTGPDAPRPTIGVYTGDSDTKIRLTPAVQTWDEDQEVYVECPVPNCDLTFEWSDSIDTFSWEYADEQIPEGTIATLGLSTVDLHVIKLKVTDAKGLYDVRGQAFWICDLPVLSAKQRNPQWKGGAFKYEFKVDAAIKADQIGLQQAGQLKLVTPDGAGEMSTPVDITKALGPGEYHALTQPLVRKGEFKWDSGSGLTGCILEWGSELDSEKKESWNLKAYGLKDANGHELLAYTAYSAAECPEATIRISDDKRLAYDEATAAYLSFCACTGATIGLLASGVGAPFSVISGMAAGGSYKIWQDRCNYAHDPIEPDPDFVSKVLMPLLPLPASSACAADDGIDDEARAAEAGAIQMTASAAYAASLNKLAGVYTFWQPGGPITYESVAALQGSEVVRYGGVLANTLADLRDAWTAAAASLVITEEDLLAAQEEIGYEGLPLWLSEQLMFAGVNPADFRAAFLASDTAEVASGWNEDRSADLDQAAKLVLGQSFFFAPGGLVLVGITEPLDNAGVTGTINIDARVVHKKPESQCVCGDTVVLQVKVDQQVIAQVPPPPANCDGASPAPTAVPVSFPTGGLAEGPHTISVLASDAVGQPGCPLLPGQDPLYHTNSDTITVFVDRTPPVVTITSQDVDPTQPGIQVFAGEPITYSAADMGCGLVGPPAASVPSNLAAGTQTVCVADRAGNIGTADVEVIRPFLDNGTLRAQFTDYGTSGDRFPHEQALPAEIVWLPFYASSQVYSWEGNLRYDAGRGAANHLLADPEVFTVEQGLHREGPLLASRSANSEFRIDARHWLDGASLHTELKITNISGQPLSAVQFAWMLDADLVRPGVDPCCPTLPWLGFGAGRWFGEAGQGLQTDLNTCAGLVPPDVSIRHTARRDGAVLPDQWSVCNPSGFQGGTCAFDGVNVGEPRYLFEQAFDNPDACVGFDQDLGIITAFTVADWPAAVTHTFTYALTLHQPGDLNADGQIDAGDFAGLEGCLAGPGSGVPAADCANLDFLCDDDVDMVDVADFMTLFTGP